MAVRVGSTSLRKCWRYSGLARKSWHDRCLVLAVELHSRVRWHVHPLLSHQTGRPAWHSPHCRIILSWNSQLGFAVVIFAHTCLTSELRISAKKGRPKIPSQKIYPWKLWLVKLDFMISKTHDLKQTGQLLYGKKNAFQWPCRGREGFMIGLNPCYGRGLDPALSDQKAYLLPL